MDGRHPQSCVLTGLPPPTLRTQPGPSSWARPSPGAGQPGTPTLDSQRPDWGERNFHCLPATWFLEVYYKWTKTKPTLGNQPLPAPAAHAHLLVSPSSSRTPEVTWTPPAGLLAALLAPWHLVLMRWSCCGPMSPSQGIWQNTKHRQRHTPTPPPSPPPQARACLPLAWRTSDSRETLSRKEGPVLKGRDCSSTAVSFGRRLFST